MSFYHFLCGFWQILDESTWCTSEKRQSWNDRIWRHDSVIGDFRAILDYRELANDTVFPDFDMIANGRSFHDRVGPNVNVVSYLHGVVVEISAIGFVWWSHDTAFSD